MRGLTLGMVLALATLQSRAQVLESHIDGRIDLLEIVVDAERLSSDGPVWWRGAVTRFGTGFLRLHMVIRSGATVPPFIVSVEGDRGGLFSYARDDFGPDGLWTAAMPAGTLVVSLIGAERPEGLELRIDSVMVEGNSGALFSTWGGVDETRPVNDPAVPPEVRALGGPVARLSFIRGGKPRSCTGFLIADDILLTNEHCVSDLESCGSMTAIFGFERDAAGRLGFGTQARCAGMVRSDFALDAALVKLDRPMSSSFGLVAMSQEDVIDGAPLVVVQHPGGAPKQVSFLNCHVLSALVDGRAASSDLAHSCDTASGSSGAPVFNGEGRVVALHHYGFAEGQVDKWTENRAVRGARLEAWLRANVPP
ncbi:serine protease [Cereibacter johrii]|uniref:trypsin-like serine peptidase n=1 Tax=Cereibacter johrii TaxID=445629 RepID=UPI002B25B7BD|nr:serine protease [Cereibacter johrii]MEA5160014.1 serine protease [Cereibacter johrii]